MKFCWTGHAHTLASGHAYCTLLEMVRAAAERAPEMVLLTNSRAGGNNIVASADAVFHRGMALSMPLAYYELQAPRSMHTKAMLVDGNISVFGSFNFDMRSAYLDTELMLAIDSEGLNAQLRQRAEDDLDHCRLVSAQGETLGASLSPGS